MFKIKFFQLIFYYIKNLNDKHAKSTYSFSLLRYLFIGHSSLEKSLFKMLIHKFFFQTFLTINFTNSKQIYFYSLYWILNVLFKTFCKLHNTKKLKIKCISVL